MTPPWAVILLMALAAFVSGLSVWLLNLLYRRATSSKGGARVSTSSSSSSGSSQQQSTPTKSLSMKGLPHVVQRALTDAVADARQLPAGEDQFEVVVQSLTDARRALTSPSFKRSRVACPTGPNAIRFIVTMDPGQDLDDEMLLVLMGALTQRHQLACKGVVTCLAPADVRAKLASGTLRSLGLSWVPVAAGTDGGAMGDQAAVDQVKQLAYLGDETASSARSLAFALLGEERAGFALMHTALSEAKRKSIVLVVVASLKDSAELLRDAEALFVEKVKQVVIQGGVDPFEPGVAPDGVYLEPDSAHNNEFDAESSKFFYRRCQELGVPLVVISRFAAYGCKVPRTIYDEMAATGGQIGRHLQSVQRGSIERLWRRACAAEADPARLGLPSRCDKPWFCATFCGGDGNDRDGSESIWDCVKTFNMYDPLALVAAVPDLLIKFFDASEISVNGTTHKVIGVDKEHSGVKEGSGLQEWLYDALMEGARMDINIPGNGSFSKSDGFAQLSPDEEKKQEERRNSWLQKSLTAPLAPLSTPIPPINKGGSSSSMGERSVLNHAAKEI